MLRFLTKVCASVLVAVFLLNTTARTRAQVSVPTPESAIGFAPCTDYKLATYEQIETYFLALDAASNRIQVFEIGKTTEGRSQLMAAISSEANLQRLDHFKAISARLAKDKTLSADRARALATEGRAVVWIDFGLHSTEVAHAQTAPLLAYRAVTDESPEMHFIRNNVIFLLVPNMNPDGTTLVANWYMQHLGTPYQETAPPTLYQEYAGHDNNRDWFMFNLRETKNIARQLYEEWFPQIVYDHHQSAPFPARIFVPPFDDPMNPNIPPLVMRGINFIGEAITRRLEQEGKTGVISRLNFDTWWNGGMRTAPYFHNMVGILTETSHASATPAKYDPKSFPPVFTDGRPTLQPTTHYPNPYQGGEWHLSDTCNYIQSASIAVLDVGAKRREEWLYDIHKMGQNAVAAGRGEVYVISKEQWDPGTTIRLINVLRRGGVEIHLTTKTLRLGDREYPENSFVISAAQPFRPYLTDLLNPQVYPDVRPYPNSPLNHPYDITGWTLPLQMGVTTNRHTDVDQVLAHALEPVVRAANESSLIPQHDGFGFVLDTRANDSFTAVNRLLAIDQTVYRSKESIEISPDTTWPAGAFIVPAADSTKNRIEQVTSGLGLSVAPLSRPPDELRLLKSPRVGLYRGWGANTDEGWTRFVLEEFEFPYTTLRDEDLRNNRLADFDVIILPDASYNRMLTGLTSKVAPPEYGGGMTPRGVSHLFDFVEAGGILVTLDTASELPIIDFGLPIRDISAEHSDTEFYVPGTLVTLNVDPTHPVGYGMPQRTTAFFAHSPVFEVETNTSPPHIEVVANYPETDLLRSGWMLGEEILAKQSAVVAVTIGRGRVIMLGIRAQHRGQTHGTFKLLFNAIYLGSTQQVED